MNHRRPCGPYFPRLKYRLLALDLDGTLLQPDHTVAPEEREAIAAAQAAGCLVLPCTGRAWHESADPLKPVEGLSLGVFVTGCLVQEIDTGRVVHQAGLAPELAHEVIEHLRDLPEAVLAFRTRHTAGYDFLVTGDGELTDNTAWWFAYTGTLHTALRHPGPEDLTDCVRVGVVSTHAHLAERLGPLREAFGDRITAHSFPGLVREGTATEDRVEILEVFPAGVSKWTGIRSVADAHGIPDEEIAFVGDQINDLPALRAAGCSVAMGNAVPEAVEAARHRTAGHTEHGVAQAIHKMLDGDW